MGPPRRPTTNFVLSSTSHTGRAQLLDGLFVESVQLGSDWPRPSVCDLIAVLTYDLVR
jgi:hypothetical protein